MKKKILLAIDDSINSIQSLDYVGHLFGESGEFTFSLFHVQPMVSEYLLEEARRDARANGELTRLKKKNAEAARRIIEKSRNRMIRSGISADRIDGGSEPRHLGLVKDILESAQKRQCDAIVVGRRGLSRIQKALMGSVSSKLLEHSELIPVWMIDGEIESRDIFVAVDGSENSLRAMDYLGFIFGSLPDIRLTLFHVMPSGREYGVAPMKTVARTFEEVVTQGDRRMLERFFTEARNILDTAGIPKDRVETRTLKRRTTTGKMILSEAGKGNFGTVVVGRRGVDKAFYFGSVSKYVANGITNRALWLIP